MKSFYKENRVFSILMIVAASCLLVIVSFLIIYFFKGQGTDKYGDRLSGINTVKISKNKLEEIKSTLIKENNIDRVETNVEGKIIYTTFYLKAEGVSSDGVNASLKLLNLYSEEEKKFYDFQFIVEKENKDAAETFPIIGAKNSNSANVVWTKY